jgi:hypothetical protein
MAEGRKGISSHFIHSLPTAYTITKGCLLSYDFQDLIMLMREQQKNERASRVGGTHKKGVYLRCGVFTHSNASDACFSPTFNKASRP